MEAICHLKYQRYGARKVGQVLDQIRGKSLFQAEQILNVIPRACGDVVRKAVHSAGANLSVKAGRKLDLKKVWIVTAYANQGPMKHMRRMNAGPQGRGMPFRRNVCHMTVTVSDTKE